MPNDIDAKAYILWGGQYDVRELVLIEWQGEFTWEDETGGYMTIHDHLQSWPSAREAKRELLSFLFRLGEPGTWIDFGPDGIIRDRDPSAWQAIEWEARQRS